MKRIEQKVEDTWCLEDMFESDDFWEEEFGRLQRMIFQEKVQTVFLNILNSMMKQIC